MVRGRSDDGQVVRFGSSECQANVRCSSNLNLSLTLVELKLVFNIRGGSNPNVKFFLFFYIFYWRLHYLWSQTTEQRGGANLYINTLRRDRWQRGQVDSELLLQLWPEQGVERGAGGQGGGHHWAGGGRGLGGDSYLQQHAQVLHSRSASFF